VTIDTRGFSRFGCRCSSVGSPKAVRRCNRAVKTGDGEELYQPSFPLSMPFLGVWELPIRARRFRRCALLVSEVLFNISTWSLKRWRQAVRTYSPKYDSEQSHGRVSGPTGLSVSNSGICLSLVDGERQHYAYITDRQHAAGRGRSAYFHMAHNLLSWRGTATSAPVRAAAGTLMRTFAASPPPTRPAVCTYLRTTTPFHTSYLPSVNVSPFW